MALSREQRRQIEDIIGARCASRARELLENVERARTEEHRSRAELAGDPGDRSVADLLAGLDNAEVSRDVGELRALEAARVRLASGSYGECESCGDEIAFERLRAQPTAQRCLECQRIHEKTFAYPAVRRL